MKAALRSIATLDLRSLALFRIFLGVVVALDALGRLADVEAFYADSGIRPRGKDVLATFLHSPSIYFVSGSVGWATFLLAVTAIAAVALAVGYRTRIASIVVWLLIVSVQNRNPTIESGADSVEIMCCLLACFMPIGARFSLDARRQNTPRDHKASTWGTFIFVLQLVAIYFFNVINKIKGATWRNGTAVRAALNIDQHTTPIGYFVLDHLLWLCKPLTWGALAIETSCLLLLVPVTTTIFTQSRVDRARLALVVAMWALHVGFAICLYLALFSPICMVAWLAVLPSSIWERGPLAKLDAKPGTAEPPTLPAWAAVVAGIAMLLQIVSNTMVFATVTVPGEINAVTARARIGPTWKMFAPNPGFNDGWFIFPATLANGDVVDLFRDGEPVVYAKPKYVAHLYKNGRWRQMMMGHPTDKDGRGVKPIASWLCREWNRDHDDDHKIKTVGVTFMLEKTRADFKFVAPEKKEMLVDSPCPAEPQL